MLIYEYGNMTYVSPHIYAPVKQEIMDCYLKAPKHSDHVRVWRQGENDPRQRPEGYGINYIK